MCDFRHIKEIQLNDGILVNVEKYITIEPYQFPFTLVKGFYCFAGSGSVYTYYDGMQWLSEGKGYEVTKFEDRRLC